MIYGMRAKYSGLAGFIVVATACGVGCSRGTAPQQAMDRDLMEVTIPQLQQHYAAHKYTVTQVVRWYVARIDKYNGIYRAVQNLDAAGALATAAREDAEAGVRGPLWG